ncbi:MAG: hypothetical protein AAF773_23030 [Cyanobacteria bacterium P01_D01_bin.115]
MRIFFVLMSAIALSPTLMIGNSPSASAGQLGGSATSSSSATEPLFESFTINFDDFAAGTYIVGDEWADYGVNISVDSNRNLKGDKQASLPLRLFDSNCRSQGSSDKSLPKCSGGDHDLATGDAFGTEAQGNVLIIQEDNSKRKDRSNLGNPDDDARGGTITFHFEQAIKDLKLGFLDFDDRDRGEGFIRFYAGADDTEAAMTFNLSSVEALVNPGFTGDNSLRIFASLDMAIQRLAKMRSELSPVKSGFTSASTLLRLNVIAASVSSAPA